MKIITISREFASGGRELGKRLADAMGIPCYDHEIIELVAKQQGMDKNYVEYLSEQDLHSFYAKTIAHRFLIPHPMGQQPAKVITAEHEIMKKLAMQGDCVIIGRCADVIFREMHPFDIFVYADEPSKLERCKAREQGDRPLSDKEIRKRIKQIDKERIAYRRLFTETDWADMASYHLCVNTSGIEIKTLVPAIAAYTAAWFQKGDA